MYKTLERLKWNTLMGFSWFLNNLFSIELVQPSECGISFGPSPRVTLNSPYPIYLLENNLKWHSTIHAYKVAEQNLKVNKRKNVCGDMWFFIYKTYDIHP